MIGHEILSELSGLCSSCELPECEMVKEALEDPVVGSLVGHSLEAFLRSVLERVKEFCSLEQPASLLNVLSPYS